MGLNIVVSFYLTEKSKIRERFYNKTKSNNA